MRTGAKIAAQLLEQIVGTPSAPHEEASVPQHAASSEDDIPKIAEAQTVYPPCCCADTSGESRYDVNATAAASFSICCT